jgi:hypothetical protein
MTRRPAPAAKRPGQARADRDEHEPQEGTGLAFTRSASRLARLRRVAGRRSSLNLFAAASGRYSDSILESA